MCSIDRSEDSKSIESTLHIAIQIEFSFEFHFLTLLRLLNSVSSFSASDTLIDESNHES